MTEKNHQDQEYDQYNMDSDEMESIDQNEYASRSQCDVYHCDDDHEEGSRDDYMNDTPCVTTCCCCCSLGLGSIIAGVLFMVSRSILLNTTNYQCAYSIKSIFFYQNENSFLRM